MESNSKSQNTSQLTKVGLVLDSHGLRGDIYVFIFSGDVSWIDDVNNIYITPQGVSQPTAANSFAVKKIKPFKKGFIAQLNTVTDRNKSDALKKHEVWIDSEIFVSENGEQPFLQELLNFTIEDKRLGLLGKIQEFSFNGMQDLLVIDKKVNGQNVEIPFVKEFVVHIDYQNGKIQTDLPEGLIEINEKD